MLFRTSFLNDGDDHYYPSGYWWHRHHHCGRRHSQYGQDQLHPIDQGGGSSNHNTNTTGQNQNHTDQLQNQHASPELTTSTSNQPEHMATMSSFSPAVATVVSSGGHTNHSVRVNKVTIDGDGDDAFITQSRYNEQNRSDILRRPTTQLPKFSGDNRGVIANQDSLPVDPYHCYDNYHHHRGQNQKVLETAQNVADLISCRRFDDSSLDDTKTSQQQQSMLYSQSMILGGVTFLGVVGVASFTGLAGTLASRIGFRTSRLLLSGVAATTSYHFSNKFFDERSTLANLQIIGTHLSPTEPSKSADALCSHPVMLQALLNEQRRKDQQQQQEIQHHRSMDFYSDHDGSSYDPYGYMDNFHSRKGRGRMNKVESKTVSEFEKVLKHCQDRQKHHQQQQQQQLKRRQEQDKHFERTSQQQQHRRREISTGTSSANTMNSATDATGTNQAHTMDMPLPSTST
mmetsp:Transcript_19743/g.47681  ORF Transcript_19743/g.47681 Transcript_19743/m.47681 type:complete len:457 (-) Transcript_19743:127-1497(-)